MAYSVAGGRGPEILAVSGTMIALTTIAVALRFWARLVAPKNGLWWDDWLSLAALLFIWALCAMNIYWVYLGLGQHVANLNTPFTKLLRVLYPVENMYNTALILVKLSLLMFYVRVFKAVRIYQIAFWVVGFILFAWGIAISLITLFACIPIRKNWDVFVPGHCLERQSTLKWMIIANILTDLIVLILPMPMLWHQQISFRGKLGLCGLFAAGYLVLILAILRLVLVSRDEHSLVKDVTWNVVRSIILLICEVAIALISSCIPSIFSLVKYTTGKRFSRFRSEPGNPNKVGSSNMNLRMGSIKETVQEHSRSDIEQPESAQEPAQASSERPFRDPSANGSSVFSQTV